MRRVIISLICCLAISLLLPAESRAISGSLTTKLSPNYVVNSQARVYDGWESQTNLLVNFPGDFHALIMIFRGLEGYGPSRMGDENQYIVWKKTQLGKAAFFDLGVIYHDLNVPPPGLWNDRGDIIKPFAEIGKNFPLDGKNRLVLSVRTEVPFPAETNRPERGMYVYLKAKHDRKIARSLTFSQLAWLLKDDGASGRDAIWLGRYVASMEWEFYKNFSIIPAYMLNTPFQATSKKDGRETFHTPSLALQYKF